MPLGRALDENDTTLFLETLEAHNPILPKCKEAINYCVAVAEKGNVDGALCPGSKAFRGARSFSSGSERDAPKERQTGGNRNRLSSSHACGRAWD